MNGFLVYVVRALELACTLQHRLLPNAVDDVVQQAWIMIFGYHCPLTMWSIQIDDKYRLGVWDDRLSP